MIFWNSEWQRKKKLIDFSKGKDGLKAMRKSSIPKTHGNVMYGEFNIFRHWTKCFKLHIHPFVE